MMMNYKDFRAKWKKEHKKFSLAEFNKAWREHSGSKEQPKPAEKSQDIQVEAQPGQPFLAEPLPAEVPAIPEKATEPMQEQPKEPSMNKEMYKAIANAFHQTSANILEIATKGKHKVMASEVELLNEGGVVIIKKYDKSRFMEKYSAELAYGLTLLGIASRIMIEIQADKAEAEKAKSSQPVAQGATNASQQ